MLCVVNKTKERIKSQRNIILEELARNDDKKYATQSILESIFNKDEADKILKDIRVSMTLINHHSLSEIVDQYDE
jgi:hypothetical protein